MLKGGVDSEAMARVSTILHDRLLAFAAKRAGRMQVAARDLVPDGNPAPARAWRANACQRLHVLDAGQFAPSRHRLGSHPDTAALDPASQASCF
jgi:hypothetical protein